MSTVSLYRKYRSQRFGDLCGQEHVTTTLQNAVRGDRVAHAYLFCGPRGTGKTSAARLLAKALNCEAAPLRAGPNRERAPGAERVRPAAEPCDACASCEQIRAGSSLDVLEVDAASHRGIDDVRALREAVAYQPVQGRFKVYIIDEAHMLTGEAFNALLKTLEEPPAHVVFILATTEVHKVPATILSRCQRFDFRRGTRSQIEGRLREVTAAEELQAEPEALALLARHANGSWRDALSLLEQTIAYAGEAVTAEAVRTVLGLVSDEILFEIGDAVRAGDAAAIFLLIDEAIAAGKDPRQLLFDLTEHFRALLLSAAGAVLPADERSPRVREQAAGFGLPRLLAAVEALATGEKELRWSQQSRLLVEVLLTRLAQPPSTAAPTPERAAPLKPPTAATPAARETPAARATAPSGPGPSRAAPAAPRSAEATQRDAVPPAPWSADPPPLSVGDSRAGVEAEEEADLDALFTSAAEASRAASAASSETPAKEAAAAPASGGNGASAAVPAADGALGSIAKQWRLIREELKRRKQPSIAGVLAHATPRALDGETLIVELPTSHLTDLLKLSLARSPEVVPDVIRGLCGVGCRVQPVTAGEAGPARAPAKATRPQAEAAPVAEAAREASASGKGAAPEGGRELIHDVVDLFEGKIVDE